MKPNTNTEAESRKRSASLRLSPDEAQVMVARYGSIKGTAKAIGVSRSTISYWLDPARARRLTNERNKKKRAYINRLQREWRAQNRTEVLARQREYQRERYRNDPSWRQRKLDNAAQRRAKHREFLNRQHREWWWSLSNDRWREMNHKRAIRRREKRIQELEEQVNQQRSRRGEIPPEG